MQDANPEKAPLPEGVKGWSWAALIIPQIWGPLNKVWWGILAFIPYINFIVSIWLALKGREMAWRAGEWKDVESFRRAQRVWTIWAFVLLVALVFGGALWGWWSVQEYLAANPCCGN